MRTAALLLLSAVSVSRCRAAELTVDPQGDLKTVQAAIDAAPAGSSEPINIRIKPGEYRQRLTLPKEKPNLHLIGLGTSPEQTALSFDAKASDPKPGGGTIGTTGSATVYMHGSDCSAENLTFANTAGMGAGQAVALKTTGDRLTFSHCRFLGYQDTLYLTAGRCYLHDCYIAGTVDFIFGDATALFETCELHSLGPGFLTAARTSPDHPFGFVFLNCKLTADDSLRPGSVALGRPWQWQTSSASVIFAHTRMGPQIDPVGWNPWDAKNNADPAAHSRYSEFDSHALDGGTIDLSHRVNWTKPIDNDTVAMLTIEHVLGGQDHWSPKP